VNFVKVSANRLQDLQNIVGTDIVFTKQEIVSTYGSDAGTIREGPQLPAVAVRPSTGSEVATILKQANQYHIRLLLVAVEHDWQEELYRFMAALHST